MLRLSREKTLCRGWTTLGKTYGYVFIRIIRIVNYKYSSVGLLLLEDITASLAGKEQTHETTSVAMGA